MQKNIHSFGVSKFVFQNLDAPHPGSAESGRDYANEFRKIIEENREDIPLADVVLGGRNLTDAAAQRYKKLELANADLPVKDASRDTPENFSKTLDKLDLHEKEKIFDKVADNFRMSGLTIGEGTNSYENSTARLRKKDSILYVQTGTVNRMLKTGTSVMVWYRKT